MIKLKLLLENEETDIKFRKDAEKLLNKTKSYISKNGDKIPIGKNGVVLDVNLVDSSYKDLIFLFSKVGSGDFSLTKSNQGSLKGDKEYLMTPHEVPALVQGMYKQAKTERKPLSKIMNNYLDTYNLKPNDKKDVLVVWNDFIRKNLPRAK